MEHVKSLFRENSVVSAIAVGVLTVAALVVALNAPLEVLGILVALAAVALVVAKPEIGLALMVPALFFEADQFSLAMPFGRIRLYHMLAVLLFGRVLFDVATGRRTWRKTPLDWPIAIYLALNLVLISVAPEQAIASKVGGLLVLLGLMYWTVANLVRTRAQFLNQAKWLMVATLGIALYGLFQVFAVWFASRYDIQLWNGPIIHSEVIPFGRPYATFVEPDWYGTTMAAALIAVSVTALSRVFKNRQVELISTSLILVIATILSAVRGGWIALALTVPLVLWLNRRYFKILESQLVRNVLVSLVVVVGLALVATPTIRHALTSRVATLFTSDTLEDEPRFLIMQDGLELFTEHPWLGQGPAAYTTLGTLPNVSPMYAVIVGMENFQTNALITVLLDTGLVGLALVVWMVVRFVRTVWRAVRQSQPDQEGEQVRTVTIGLAAAVLVLALAYQVSTGVWLGLTWYVLSLIISGSLLLGLPAVKGPHKAKNHAT